MNIVLLRENDWINANTVKLTDYRARHLITVLKVVASQTLRVGLINGDRGLGTVTRVTGEGVELEVALSDAPLHRHPTQLVLALPRPKMLRRVFRSVAEFGVAELHLIHSYRVEKSYWQTPHLNEDKVEMALIQGLERSGDTVLPRVFQHKRFKPFMEDVLPAISAETTLLIAHPGNSAPSPADTHRPTTLLIGPEGGFTEYEIQKFVEVGFKHLSLGSRIHRVETVVPLLVGKLFY